MLLSEEVGLLSMAQSTNAPIRNMKYAYEMSHVMQDVIVTANMQTSQEDKMARIFAWAACLSVYVVIRMCVHCC